MSGFVVWMTGLSGAGKSTLASLLTQELSERGLHVECLDGDEVRKNLSHGLGFAREDRDRNVRRIGYVARMVARSGACAITAAISPYRALRDEIRSKTENFIEVYCECPIDVLTERDPKGLYKRALAGELKNFTGVSDPYEAPEKPEVHLRTHESTPEECIKTIVGELERRGLLGLARGGALQPAPYGGEVFEARQLGPEEVTEKRLEVSSALAAEVRFVSAGFLSPLSGFMTEREAVKVRKSSALERGTPWWDEPFVLPLPREHDLKAHDVVTLVCENAPVALVTVEHIWSLDGQSFAAGPIDACVHPDGAISARALRRLWTNNHQSTVCALFSNEAPSESAKVELRAACKLFEAVVLMVSDENVGAWTRTLSSEQKTVSVVVVPGSFPMDQARARLVISKSIGAASSMRLSAE